MPVTVSRYSQNENIQVAQTINLYRIALKVVGPIQTEPGVRISPPFNDRRGGDTISAVSSQFGIFLGPGPSDPNFEGTYGRKIGIITVLIACDLREHFEQLSKI